MNRILICMCLFWRLLSSAQHIQKKAIIDSINQVKWNENNNVNVVDSLSNFSLIKIPKIKIDSVFSKKVATLPHVNESIPVTLYQIMKSPSVRKWYIYGQNNVLFNQAAFSNWNAGVNNNVGVSVKFNYSLIYKKHKHYLDNNFQVGYGFVSSEGQSFRKIDDYINIVSNYGYDLIGNYYLSIGAQFMSQFSPGYNYSKTPNPSYNDLISKFMAPGYLNLGIGILYNPKENFRMIFRPATGRFTFVLDPKLQVNGNYGLERSGQRVRTEFGALANVIYKIQIMKGLSFTNQLNLFSSYISHPERVDISYTGIINVKLNKFISTIISMDLLYDHDQIQKLQMKQTLGVGFSYNLNLYQDGYKPDSNKFIKNIAVDIKG